MRMDTPVRLLRMKPGTGSRAMPEIAEKRDTYCGVEIVGSNTYWQSVSVGTKLDLTVILWKWDAANMTHAELDGVTYQISAVGRAKDKRQVKAHLIRG